MVKLVDTLGSGSSGRKAVKVQVLFRAKKTDPVLGSVFFVFGGKGLEREGEARPNRESKNPWMDF